MQPHRNPRTQIFARSIAFLILLSVAGGAHAQPIPAPGSASVSTAWAAPSARPGDQLALAVVLDIPPGFHINPDASRIPPTLDFLIPTRLAVASVSPPSSLKFGPVQLPKPKTITVTYSGSPENLDVFEGKTIFYLPVAVDPAAAPGTITLTLELTYQACNEEVCLQPTTSTVPVTLTIAPPGADPGQPQQPHLFKDFDPSAFAAILAGPAPATGVTSAPNQNVKNDFLGLAFQINSASGGGVLLLLLVALAAGFLLNFTPCVLPVIPLKILSLSKQAANRKKCFFHGLVFSAGIVASFLALGFLVAGLIGGIQQLEWGQFLSYKPVSIALAAIIIAMALSMFDLFSLRLPQKIYLFSPSHDTATGNFLLGVLTAILSTPCTGPMLGATTAWAVKQPPWLALSAFTMMGVGMAAPYLLLTANPKWVDFLPRAGAGSLLLKQTIGLLFLAVAVFLLGPMIPSNHEWWIIAALVIIAMAWLLRRTFQITTRRPVRFAITVLALLLSIGSVFAAKTLTDAGPIPWQTYSQAAFDQAQRQKKTILLEFTADWCGNCKALELSVYRDQKLAGFFADDSRYVAFRVDLTSSTNVQGWALQRKLGGGGGIPLAAIIYLPGQTQPAATFQGLFTANQLIQALQQPPP